MKSIMVHVERCNGCLTCVLACAAAHSRSGTITGAMMEKAPARLFIQAVGQKPVPILCRHCEEPACVYACMTGAMQKDPVTRVVTNEGRSQACVGCWMCIMACPYGAIVPHPGGEKLAVKCDLCQGRSLPACVEACPNGALVFTEPEEFSEQRRRAAAVPLAEGAGAGR